VRTVRLSAKTRAGGLDVTEAVGQPTGQFKIINDSSTARTKMTTFGRAAGGVSERRAVRGGIVSRQPAPPAPARRRHMLLRSLWRCRASYCYQKTEPGYDLGFALRKP